MAEVDRPIKPDQKYLQEYLERINRVEVKPFLKKNKNPYLPCNTHSQDRVLKASPRDYSKKTKSKAEIYEQIKKKNLQKFGQRKQQTVAIEQAPKKLDPKKMTINYKPKLVIQTQEYKKKDYVPKPKTTHTLPAESKEKIQYEKLIDYFNKELQKLEQEKEEFNKVATKLHFKERIKNEEGLIYSRIKSEVQKQLIKTQKVEEKDKKEQTTNRCSRKTPSKWSRVQEKDKNMLSRTYSAGQIHTIVENTYQQVKSEMIDEALEIKEHRYEVFQVNLLPSFTPQTLYQFMDLEKLKYNQNTYYQAAMKAFNSRFKKDSKGNKESKAEKEEGDHSRITTKQKFIGETRIREYEGWIEEWTPGKQRQMTNKDNYKVVWLANGDVLQEFSNDVKTFYNKAEETIKIQLKTLPAVCYHEKSKQIWRDLPDGSREIVFDNGLVDIIHPN